VEAAQDIHTLKCRMTLISPEPDYWIYGLFDLSRSQQASKHRSTKGKAPAQPTFDYHDSALRDEGLRAHLQKSYEEFKLLYGTFGMILLDQGRDVLENLLERHFARWVWAWEVERSTSRFDCHALEPQIHPRYSQITEVVDPSLFPSLAGLPLIVLEPPYILWSQRQDSRRMSSPLSCPDFPLILASHLLRLLSPNKRKPADEIRAEPLIAEVATLKEDEGPNKQAQTKPKSNFRVPPMTMDPRKWALGALLTSPPSWMSLRDKDANKAEISAAQSTDKERREATEGNGSVSPQEADSDLSDSQATIRRKASLGESLSECVAQAEQIVIDSHSSVNDEAATPPTISIAATESDDLPFDSPTSLSQLRVYLPQSEEQGGHPEARTVGYIHLKDLNLILAAVLPNMDSQDGLQDTVKDLNKLVNVIRPALDATEPPDKRTPSSTKIFASDKGVCASEPPAAKFSEHAFDTWRQLHHPNVCEVISRPSINSRPWTVAKREPEGEEVSGLSGSVYLELMGPDSTLVDVDRSLSAAHTEWCT